MKTKLSLIILLSAMFFSGCTSPKYLPSTKEIGVNEYGSYIEIFYGIKYFERGKSIPDLKGELIAVDTSELVVLLEGSRKCEVVALKDIDYFKLRYAEAKTYWWTLPLFVSSTLPMFHGFYFMTTSIANVIVVLTTSFSGQSDFTYSELTISFEEMRMFARFPQGIPEGVSLQDIK